MEGEKRLPDTISGGCGTELLTEEQAIRLSQNAPLELEATSNGAVKSTFTNYCRIIMDDAYLNGKIRWNALDGRVTVSGFFWDATMHPVRDSDLYFIRKFISDIYGISSTESIRQAIDVAAHYNAFHPIRELLNGLEWDGKPRLQELFPRFLGATPGEYTTAVTRLLFNGAIRRVFEPGVKFDYCVVLADSKQGTGKSTMCRLLALRDDWFTDSIGDLADTKKSYETIRGRWICEMAEMIATRRTKEIETIKGYLSRTSDDYRQPYGTYSEQYPRQCVFIGTTNKPHFLPEDKTGNRRFIPVFCDGDAALQHPLENEKETRAFILQCYAEAMQSAEKSLILPESVRTQLEALREEATPEDSRVGMIQEYLDSCPRSHVCTRMVFDDLFAGEFKREPTRHELAEIADIMNLSVTGWERYSSKGSSGSSKYRFTRYGSQRAWTRCK